MNKGFSRSACLRSTTLCPIGGLALGALHEVSSAGPQGEYATAATLFIAGVLARLSGQVLWVTERNDLYPPALAAVGLLPARVIFVDAAKGEILQVAEDAVRARCLVGVAAEITGALAMTASSAAAAGGGTVRASPSCCFGVPASRAIPPLSPQRGHVPLARADPALASSPTPLARDAGPRSRMLARSTCSAAEAQIAHRGM